MHLFFTLIQRSKADGGVHLDQGWLISDSLGLFNSLLNGLHIMVAIRDNLHVPSISFEALHNVLSEGDSSVTINGDMIVIIQCDQLAKLQMTNQFCWGWGQSTHAMRYMTQQKLLTQQVSRPPIERPLAYNHHQE